MIPHRHRFTNRTAESVNQERPMTDYNIGHDRSQMCKREIVLLDQIIYVSNSLILVPKQIMSPGEAKYKRQLFRLERALENSSGGNLATLIKGQYARSFTCNIGKVYV